MPRHRSSAVPLAWLYAALVVYASLYPFSDWRAPAVGSLDFLTLGWPRWWTRFDFVANLLGYLPLGFLMCVALIRGGRPAGLAALATLGAGATLALAMEWLQNFLPQRVPSNVDLGLNALGALLGAGLALALHLSGGIDRWQRTRERWFIERSAGGMALLVLWPVGLLFPTAVPFGLGHVLDRLRPLAGELLADTPWADLGSAWAVVAGDAVTRSSPLAPSHELSIVVLGLLAPSLVAFTVSAPGWRRALLALGATLLGAAATTLSTALNFGPDHALAWVTRLVLEGLAVGTLAAVLLGFAPGRVAAGLGLVALTALVMLVAQAPPDAYFTQSLQAWEQGRFIRFHGAAQWVGWAWPYVAITYLLARLAAREPRPHGAGF